MTFVDHARIHVEGGAGGNGAVSFRREAHVPRGGPDGGNGGNGGRVLMVAEAGVADLGRFRFDIHHKAQRGEHGGGRNRHGASGSDLRLPVPVGTRVSRDGNLIATLDEDGAEIQIARGGEGGVGNRAFRSSTNRAPRKAVPGTAGEATWLTLDLRLAIDVALVGLPNSGKSAVLNALTGARAPVAAYPRTTQEPAFGVMRDDAERIVLIADLPGLAEDGTARPDGHMEQLERVKVFVHCAAGAPGAPPVAQAFEMGRATLRRHVPDSAVEITVATGPLGADEADVGVDADTGDGIPDLRARILEALGS